jgi:hypothetical protein
MIGNAFIDVFSYFLHQTAVDVHRKRLHYRGILPAAEYEYDPVFISLGKFELLVKGFILKHVLVNLGAILVFDRDDKPVSLRVVIGNIEDQHVVLRSQGPDYDMVRAANRPGNLRLGVHSSDS